MKFKLLIGYKSFTSTELLPSRAMKFTLKLTTCQITIEKINKNAQGMQIVDHKTPKKSKRQFANSSPGMKTEKYKQVDYTNNQSSTKRAIYKHKKNCDGLRLLAYTNTSTKRAIIDHLFSKTRAHPDELTNSSLVYITTRSTISHVNKLKSEMEKQIREIYCSQPKGCVCEFSFKKIYR